MVWEGVIQEPQKWNNCTHWVCSKCILDWWVKNSLEAKWKFCNNFSFTPLIDSSLLKELYKLKFKWFLCRKNQKEGANDDVEYIPYERVKDHDIEWSFKHKQNISTHTDDIQPKVQNEADTKRRFNAQQNLNVRLKERMKDKIDIAQKVKDLYSGTKRKHQQIEPVSLIATETPPVPAPKLQVTEKPPKQSSKSKIIENIEVWFLWQEEVIINQKRFREIKWIPDSEPISVKLAEMKREILKSHIIREWCQRYVTCHYCFTVVTRKNLYNHIKTNCTEAIVKWEEWLTEFKKDSRLLKEHSCEDKVTEKKYKEILQLTLDMQEKRDSIAKNITKTSDEVNTCKLKALMYKNMISKINDYMVQNRRTLTDDEWDESTNDSEQSANQPKKILYEEGFSYKKEHTGKISGSKLIYLFQAILKSYDTEYARKD